ncbi:molybdate ABC transporter substrate-binding protein [Gemmatimonadota bacterium]
MKFWRTGSWRRRLIAPSTIVLWLLLSSCEQDGSSGNSRPVLRVAVAGNFATPHRELALLFSAATGVEIETSLGATGQLYAQIKNGAPYDIFLAADTTRPALLEEEGLAVQGIRFTYAIGRLALYAPTWDSVRDGELELRSRTIQHLAIANPQTAPYGAAAIDVLARWGLNDDFETRIVRGENVPQAFQFVESGASEAGFVALSHVIGRRTRHYWIVPDSLHSPIRQDAVLLQHGRSNPYARDYLEFLHGEAGRGVIARFGYSLPLENR